MEVEFENTLISWFEPCRQVQTRKHQGAYRDDLPPASAIYDSTPNIGETSVLPGSPRLLALEMIAERNLLNMKRAPPLPIEVK